MGLRKLLFFFIITLLVINTACSDKGIKKIDIDNITFGTLKIHVNGNLVKDIRLMKNKNLLKKLEEEYNNAKFLSEEKENKEPILTDGNLEEKISGSYINVDEKSSGNNFYIGYKGENTFKVIASGSSFKDGTYVYYIESKDLKNTIENNLGE
jgi:hypothetical protein